MFISTPVLILLFILIFGLDEFIGLIVFGLQGLLFIFIFLFLPGLVLIYFFGAANATEIYEQPYFKPHKTVVFEGLEIQADSKHIKRIILIDFDSEIEIEPINKGDQDESN